MKKLGFLFPGQGAQYVGMGKFLYDNYQPAQKIFETAGEVLGFDIKDKIFNGTKEDLRKTELTQPAILTTSVASATVLQEQGLAPQGAAGLSLGEYSSLVIAGSIKFEDALVIVQRRGQYMQEAVPEGKGKMVSVLGLEDKQVEKACEMVRTETDKYVVPANYNSPKQIVISGEAEGVELAKEKCHELGAKRTKEVSVSAPFHCELLEPAAAKLKVELDQIEIKEPEIDVISNVTGEPFQTAQEVRENLIRQVKSPVLLHQSFTKMINMGYDGFIDVGPGNTMTKLLSKVDRKVYQTSVDKGNNLQELLSNKEDLLK
ncbi:ACP S-malonyltransferase [Natranaerobius thermophilus]|uniref:Malonyl CoA-acyl carrier protein transacylase n=1 Tax=Natranaerobius thermophilus (strain ATCC BAA-1301 / DSM 18059 / JW/NM-WN-LF) TaxID=457570 RepID=B2A2M7_NATTJ|nr:ACP S-malonyltransferase [Natranaerobius thermophilus]ACB84942.1 malonyl CoA-acyl carrier protein transacylase [Natranaerobius thermophilus JW/NM-WN-LF]